RRPRARSSTPTRTRCWAWANGAKCATTQRRSQTSRRSRGRSCSRRRFDTADASLDNRSPVRLTMEIEGEQAPATLPGDGRDLVAFMSFAVVRGFGAQHPLIALADRLHANHGVRLGPLTTFYDG